VNARSLRLCTGAVRPGEVKALSGPAGRLIEYQWLTECDKKLHKGVRQAGVPSYSGTRVSTITKL